jgi:hypothetical protein
MLQLGCQFIGLLVFCVTSVSADEPVDFNKQIRPILNKHCTSCHGGVKQAAEISFVYAETVLPPDGWIVEPGDPDSSSLMDRITTDDPDLRMPPPDEHPEPLAEQEIALLRRWIKQGAQWGKHWSHAPPQAIPAPRVSNPTWPQYDLDRFTLARMDTEGLQPVAEAQPEEWLRRVTLDLTGLPPTNAELATFLSNCSKAESPAERFAVYEQKVQRLLASPHFGERWASMWLDLARYADSKGFEKDPHRDMWPYRDWVIRAFNADLPFDEFTIKQLAGDLLPNPTADDLIATAFHRNTQTNTEGGTDDEEFRVAAVIDRVNTTWTVWQATTFGCVQCHAHPYDAYRHEEYYRFLAFFNNTEDVDLDNDFPTFTKPADKTQSDQALELDHQLERVRHELNEVGRTMALESTTWQPLTSLDVSTTHGGLVVDDERRVVAQQGTYPPGTTYTVQTDAQPVAAVRLEILPESDDPHDWPAQGSVVTKFDISELNADGKTRPLAISEVFSDHLAGPHDPREALKDNARGFGGYPKLNGPRWAVFVLEEAYQPAPGAKLVYRLIQKASVTGNLPTYVRRFTLAYTNQDAWQKLIHSESQKEKWSQHAAFVEERRQLKGVALPIMKSRGTEAERTTRLFRRGNFLDRGDSVQPGTPQTLNTQAAVAETELNRLDMAKWLVSAENPLTSRVLVNRVWAELFGVGIVSTLEDFGTTGDPPSHPQLLDFLALQLQNEHHWRIKPLLEQLVLSATYRQTNRVSPQSYRRDPQNRLLARGPRTRLTAEMVRDQALLVSELLTPTIGGPSVMPPQPEGVWQTVYSGAQWKTAQDKNRYRRGLYTYWKRTSPYPSFLTFDAPSRDVCTARRIPTNTPLQALVTLNDVVFTESSEALAKRAHDEGGTDPEQWIRWAMKTVTQDEPSTTSIESLLLLYESALNEYQAQHELSSTNTPPSPEVKAMTVVANTILNLDEALTK